MMRLSVAQTYASCQGTEFSEACTLHELDHPRFTWKHLFVDQQVSSRGVGELCLRCSPSFKCD